MPADHPWTHGPLHVAANRLTLENGDRPFFWLGDTAWLLFTQLDLPQSERYLRNRRDKHFNVIQATLVHFIPGPDKPDSLLAGFNFSRPEQQEAYWRHVDQVVGLAETHGLYTALLPCWGSMVKNGLLNQDNVQIYADFLANRYGRRPNIIWVTGGDVRGDDGYDVWMQLGARLKARCPDKLVTFHPFGRTTSSLWFAEADWLDFHMFQSGHRRYDQVSLGAWDDNDVKEGRFGEDNWRYVLRDHAAAILRPTLDAEPSYEQIPQGLHDAREPFWQDHDVRRYAYWSVLAGACGHTYGHSAIMQFYRGSGKGAYGVKSPWQEAMHDPGSGQMGHLHQLMTSLDFASGRPADELLAQEQGRQYDRVAVFAGTGFVLVYRYNGEPFRLDLSALGWPLADASWFDPAAGVFSFLYRYDQPGQIRFTPPVKPAGHNDWVLLLRQSQPST